MDSHDLEQIFKGVANHYRIDVLQMLAISPDLSVEEIAEQCGAGYKTIAVHLRKLVSSGLVNKKYYGRRVEHSITHRGKHMLTFLRTLA